jgi:ArsR family transcriptional regulator, virulence genes transcriptional regulator
MNIAARASVFSARRMASDDDVQKAAVLLSSMSNAVRLLILLRITQREWSVNELADDLKMSQSALSQHLAKLREAKIVKGRRERQCVFYSCSAPRAIEILSLLDLPS